MPLDAVTPVKLPPDRQVEALVNGEVDAVSAFQNYAFAARERMGEAAVFWDSPNRLACHWLLVAAEAGTRSPEVLKRLCRALVQAEDFVRTDPAASMEILVREWGFAPAFVEASWPRTRLSVSFSQSLVTSLQNDAVWQSRAAGKPAEPSDVLEYLHPDVPDAVAPRAVTLLR